MTDSPTSTIQLRTVPFDTLYITRPRGWVVVILVAYVIAAVGFAALTPPWQAPDEPAHYNYIAHIAQTGTLPILQEGDYNGEELEILKQLRFPPEASIADIRYENYQPPLYYALSALLFYASDGFLLILRLLNVVLGLGSLLCLYRALELVFPTKPLIGLSALAFAALLPMHIAVTAALNNDVMAELLINASLLVLLTWMKGQIEKTEQAPTRERRQLLLFGVLTGLGLLTKVYAYVLLPVAALIIIVLTWRRVHRWRGLVEGVRKALWISIPALLIGLPLWLRNWSVYGAWDVLGLRTHDRVVSGQMTTAQFLAEYGPLAYSERAYTFTFRSFWGVFGWLGVFMDERVYTACLIFTGVLFLGLLWAIVRLISGSPDTDMDHYQITVLVVFALLITVVTASYVWYNLKFVQHQGRYFFWGLLPISALVALGWREVLQPLQGLISGALGAVLAGALFVAGLAAGDLDTWTLLMVTAASVLLLIQPILSIGTRRMDGNPDRPNTQSVTTTLFSVLTGLLRWGTWAAPFLLLLILNLLIPLIYIGPQLARP